MAEPDTWIDKMGQGVDPDTRTKKVLRDALQSGKPAGKTVAPADNATAGDANSPELKAYQDDRKKARDLAETKRVQAEINANMTNPQPITETTGREVKQFMTEGHKARMQPDNATTVAPELTPEAKVKARAEELKKFNAMTQRKY